MANWFYEDGIGEERAILIENGKIIEARIAHHAGIKAGLVAPARFVKQLVAGKRGIAQLDGGEQILLSPLPATLTEGSKLMVEVTRAAIDEHSRFKLPLARVAMDTMPRPAATVLDRIGADNVPVIICHPHEPDRFAEYGWHDVMEEAQSGRVEFAGGSLQIAVTAAMTLIDVDGDTAPLPLSLAAAQAAAAAIRRLDLQGSIGIDFPGLADKKDRQQVAEIFDTAMTGPFERTAINGFGLLQIVRRRTGPSLLELMQHRQTMVAALALLRMAERDGNARQMTLVAHPAVLKLFASNPLWIDQLSKNTGRVVDLRGDAKLSIIGGYVA